MGNLDNERAALKKVYPTRKWAMKVNRMSDDEVITIILRLESQKKDLRKTA